MSKTHVQDLLSDPTARVVTAEEAERLEARNREIDAAKRAARTARRAAMDEARKASAARKAKVAEYMAAIAALAPGASLELPVKEWPLAYRASQVTGHAYTTHKPRTAQTVVITRVGPQADLGAAAGLL